jgi:hypothetical protein
MSRPHVKPERALRALAASVAVAALAAASVAWPADARAMAQDEAGDRAALADFARRTQAYVDLHRRLEGPLPALQVSSDPAEIRRAIDALGEAIRTARSGAKQGDIFTPRVVRVFARLIREGCAGRYEELLARVTEEAEPSPGPLTPNMPWPEGAPFSAIPSSMLCSLPELPPELEYRFIGRDLVLRDGHADMIVDFIPGAIPPVTAAGARER